MSLVDDGVGVIAWQSPPVRNRWLVPWMHPEPPPSEWDALAARHWVAEHLPRPVMLVPGPFTAFDARAQRILVLGTTPIVPRGWSPWSCRRWLAMVSRRRRLVMLWDTVWPLGVMFPLVAFVLGHALRPL